MCGKFTQMASWAEVVAFSRGFGVTEGEREPGSPDGERSGNDAALTVTPMRFAHVIHLGEDGERRVTPMRWGFSDRRADGPAIPKHMHARCETIDRLPTFADSFAHRRGVLLVKTFNEGEEVATAYDDGTPTGRMWTRQWTIQPTSGEALAIAVVFEDWVKGAERLSTFVMVTTPPNPLVARITDRMPAMLDEDDLPVWLGEARAPLDEVKGLLKPHDDGGAWAMAPEDPSKKPPTPRRPKAARAAGGGGGQGSLF